MPHYLLKTIARLEKFSHRIWYTPVVALLAAADLFILIIPTDALLISNVALRPKRWITIALWVTAGSALGSLFLTLGIQAWGGSFLDALGISMQGSSTWETTARWMRDYQGPTLALFGAGPFPLQPAVVVAASAKVNPGAIFFWVALGRAAKFFFFAWAATHAPRLLDKLWGVRGEVKALHEAEAEVQNEARHSEAKRSEA